MSDSNNAEERSIFDKIASLIDALYRKSLKLPNFVLYLFMGFLFVCFIDEASEITFMVLEDKEDCKCDKPSPPPGHVWLIPEEKVSIPQVFKAKACSSKEEGKGKCIDALVLHGGINELTEGQLSEGLNLYKDEVQAVCLASHGGNMDDMSALYEKIEKSGLDICMASQYRLSHKTDPRIPEDAGSRVLGGDDYTTKCQSACTFLLYASDRRIALGKEFEIRVHKPGRTYCIGGEETKKDFFYTYREENMMHVLEKAKSNPNNGVTPALVDEFHELVISREYSNDELLPIPYEKAFGLRLFNADESTIP